MSDLIAGPSPGGTRGRGPDPGNDGAPPLVLMAALVTAALIAVTLVALFGRFGGGDDPPTQPVRDAAPIPAAAPVQRERVTLAVTLLGGGDGVIQIQPGDIACIRSCEHEFDRGTRVTVTADASSGSTFAGWSDACAGTGRCSLRMDTARALDATFDRKPAASLCDDPIAAADDPACADDLDAGSEELDPGADDLAPPAVRDCADGRDNDRDGLTDAAQDPDCTTGNAEAGTGAAPGATAPPPPTLGPKDCSDGRDNDGDGLTDKAQDPGCDTNGTEAD